MIIYVDGAKGGPEILGTCYIEASWIMCQCQSDGRLRKSIRRRRRTQEGAFGRPTMTAVGDFLAKEAEVFLAAQDAVRRQKEYISSCYDLLVF